MSIPSKPFIPEKSYVKPPEDLKIPDSRVLSYEKPVIDEDYILAKLDEFVKDASAQTMEFPSTLNSYHRQLAHRLAEERNLLHESHG